MSVLHLGHDNNPDKHMTSQSAERHDTTRHDTTRPERS